MHIIAQLYRHVYVLSHDNRLISVRSLRPELLRGAGLISFDRPIYPFMKWLCHIRGRRRTR